MDLRIEPCEWELVYPAFPHDPIGSIRRDGHAYAAWLRDEDLGDYPTGDAAAEAVWARFLEASASKHAHASVTHGTFERHQSASR